MSPNAALQPGQNERRKKARKAFAAFLKRVKKACRLVQNADEWAEFVEPLRDALIQYGDTLSPNTLHRLQRALQFTDATRSGVSRSCDVLEFELGHALDALPPAGVGSLIGLGIAAAIVVGVGVGVASLNAKAVGVGVFNDGCAPLVLNADAIPGLGWVLGALGVDLPDAPIRSGERANLSLPPITVELDGATPGRITWVVLGVSLHIPLGQVDELWLDGELLTGRRLRIALGDRTSHEVVVICR